MVPTLLIYRLRVSPYSQRTALFDNLHLMPAHTEARIQQLCTEALAAQTQSDVERIIPELRAALEEHIRLAKESLEGQLGSMSALNALSSKAAPSTIPTDLD